MRDINRGLAFVGCIDYSDRCCYAKKYVHGALMPKMVNECRDFPNGFAPLGWQRVNCVVPPLHMSGDRTELLANRLRCCLNRGYAATPVQCGWVDLGQLGVSAEVTHRHPGHIVHGLKELQGDSC